MEPKISRKATKRAAILLAIAVILCIIGIAVTDATGSGLPCALALIFTFYVIYKASAVMKCPHCGTAFRGLTPNAPNAGYCRKCGKLMEFDEDAE